MPNNLTGGAIFLRLMTYLRAYLWVLPIIIMGFAMSAVGEVWIAKLLQYITDAINQSDRHAQKMFPLLILALFLLRGVGAFLGNYFAALVSRNLVHSLRCDLFAKILSLPQSYFLTTPVGVLTAKMLYDVEQVTAASSESIVSILKDGLTVLALMGFLLYSNWRLSAVLFLVLPPILYLVRHATKKFAQLSADMQNSMGQIGHIAHEALGGQAVVKNFGAQQDMYARFASASHDNLARALKMTMVGAINTPLVQFCMAAAMCVVIWLALLPSVMGDMSAGGFVAYLTAAGLLVKPVRALTDVNAKLQRGIVAGRSVFAILDMDDETDTGMVDKAISGEIVFDGVSVSYPDGTQALDNIHLHIKKGQTVALVGKSGAGKSTLVSLLTRTILPTQGAISIDGVALEAYKLAHLRHNIAQVSQEIVLFSGTVYDNIAFGENAHKAKEAVYAAAAAAYADEFIEQLPDGYDSYVGERGLQLSGGQRQRLVIARALLKDAPILLFDEATSALDNRSEAHIQAALENASRGRTTIIVAHRLSTIAHADCIVVMNKGRIVETGTHQELLAKGGHYAQLYQNT